MRGLAALAFVRINRLWGIRGRLRDGAGSCPAVGAVASATISNKLPTRDSHRMYNRISAVAGGRINRHEAKVYCLPDKVEVVASEAEGQRLRTGVDCTNVRGSLEANGTRRGVLENEIDFALSKQGAEMAVEGITRRAMQ